MTEHTRRNLLWLGGAALAAAALSAGPGLYRRMVPRRFDFVPVAGLPGFRRTAQAEFSAGTALFAGLDAGEAPAAAAPGGDICALLFGAALGEAVPVAYFSDFRCPYCRVLTPLLLDLKAAADPPIRLVWHELPLLGAGSVLAARAALAAERQGAGDAMHLRLARSSFAPSPGYLRDLAEALGIDGERLVADMQAPAIDRQLAVSAGLARRFGFVGTPALVVGRTAHLGRIAAPDLRRLIALEADEAATAPCA
ncbi:protein-disulfide isomerase [Rhodovulum iodosum]|uniref:Protein-disulfide isomerase n=1 Tax=Rhodovulum iodosum TaxID=68291 RepID=A0ABV3XSL8_9RHOB|nr:DsbA family protein [Rhodovulum robiginosum]RSK31290.1 hypothetical protein EJA01_14150 [Rhodovulum robiginosum]